MINELKDHVEGILGEEIGLKLFFIVEDGESKLLKTVEVDDEVHNELLSNFNDKIQDELINNEELSLIDLLAADNRNNAIYSYDLDEKPVELSFIDDALNETVDSEFDFTDDEFNNLSAIIAVIGNHENQVALYKHHYPISLIKKDFGVNIFKSGNNNRFVKLNKNILRINSKFDFFYLNGDLYVVNLKVLERFFGFTEAIVSMAENAISDIDDFELIDDTSVFEQRLDDISFARKLAGALGATPVLGSISNEDIITFVSSHPKLRNKIKLNEEGTRIILSSKVSQNLFIKLLNDDYLQSDLTHNQYESLAKDSI